MTNLQAGSVKQPGVKTGSNLPKIGTIRKVTPLIGAEILDVDLRKLTPELIAGIRATLLESSVVFFRDQTLTEDEHKALGRAFGKLHIHPLVKTQIATHPEIVVIETDANSTRVAGELWHSDATADPEPPLGSLLYMREAPANGGGDTLFASTAAAYDALSPSMKEFLEGLTAIHDGEQLRVRVNALRNPDERQLFSEHPVVRTHPETGRKCLFVNRVYTSHIVQLTKSESDAVLAYLFAHMEIPQFQCRFKWQTNSIAFWDNRSALHHAVWDYFPQRRFAHRVTICGDRPV